MSIWIGSELDRLNMTWNLRTQCPSNQILVDQKMVTWLHDIENKKACLRTNGNSCMPILSEKQKPPRSTLLKMRSRCRENLMNILSVQMKLEEIVESELITMGKITWVIDLVESKLHQEQRKVLVDLPHKTKTEMVKTEKNNSRSMWILEVKKRPSWPH